MKLRAGLYQRVSDDDSGRSRSVEQQNAAGREAASRAGWRVVAAYDEPDRSASRYARKDRPEWDRLLADVAAGKLDVVVLWEPSRGERKLTGWSYFLDSCRERGVKVYITSHGHLYDLGNARDWRSLAEDGVDSAYESDKISARTRRGLADAISRGQPVGRVPYGFRRVHPPGRPLTQEPDPATAPIVAEIIGRIADGDAISAIVSDLERRGVPSPTGRPRWARHSVTWLVTNSAAYLGKQRLNGGPLLDGNWEAIVDPDVFRRAEKVLRDPARAPRGRGIRPGAARHLLSYIATCGGCGGPLSVQRRIVAGGESVPHYRCTRTRAGCVEGRAEWMDLLVTEAVIAWCSRPKVYEAITAVDDREVQAARDEAASERARLAGFERAAISGKISADSFARISAGIGGRVAELDARAEELATPPALRDLLGGSEAAGADIRARWAGMPVAGRRRVVSALSAPSLAPTGRGGDPRSPWRVRMNFKA